MTGPGAAAKRTVLVVEDEYFIADDLARVFQAAGAEVVGPVSNVNDALHLIGETERLDGAVLDVNLQGQHAFVVADALVERGVPFVFASGYDKASIPPRFAHVTRCEKPVDPRKVAQSLFG